MRIARIIVTLLLAFFVFDAFGNEATPLAQDPVVEQRLIAIGEELRCLVCQNESLASSRADLANDLRQEIRDMIKAGKTDTQIMDYLVARYGDFVRYRPPVKPTTWLLWSGPFLLLLGGIAALINFLRNRTRETVTPDLTTDEKRRAQALLSEIVTTTTDRSS